MDKPKIRRNARLQFNVLGDTIQYDTIRWTILTCAQKLTSSQLSLPHGTKQKRIMKKLKTEMLRRNGLVVKSVESVRRLEGSLRGERFVEEVGD